MAFNILWMLTIYAAQFSIAMPLADDRSSRVAAVLEADFPDPSVVFSEGLWYAFATSGNGNNIQVAFSPSFIEHDWVLLNDTDPLPDPGLWATTEGGVWAPDIIQLADGRWVMYYAATALENGDKHCVGSAISTSILGPYVPSPEPFACPLEAGGAIDPDAFQDPISGNLYVVYKVDGNSMNNGGGPCRGNMPNDGSQLHPTPILMQQVNATDGATKINAPVTLLDRDDADGPLIEAPSLMYKACTETYFLTFSSNCYATSLYDISFAWSRSLETAFTKSSLPLMTSDSTPLDGPGGADLTPEGQYALFHSTVDYVGSEPVRYMFAAELHQAGEQISAKLLL